MPCPICGQKPMNCDCTELERTSHNEIEELEEQLEKANTEIARLKRGEFTEEEFQNLCHNLNENDYCRFKKGCEEYQEMLFGKH